LENEKIVEILGSVIPVVIISLLFLYWGFKSKKYYLNKMKNAVKATVTNVIVQDERNDDGSVYKYRYIIELSYLYNGNQVVNKYNSVFEYEVGSTIDLEIEQGVILSILTNPPKDTMDDYRSLNLHGHQILFGVGYFFLGVAIFGFFGNIASVIGGVVSTVFFSSVLLFVYFLLNKRKRKLVEQTKMIKSGGYSAYLGKIVDMKKESHSKNGRDYECFYPVVEYTDGFTTKKKVIYRDCKRDMINQNLLIYKEKSSGKIFSEYAVKFLEIRIKVLNVINVILLLLIALIILEYFL